MRSLRTTPDDRSSRAICRVREHFNDCRQRAYLPIEKSGSELDATSRNETRLGTFIDAKERRVTSDESRLRLSCMDAGLLARPRSFIRCHHRSAGAICHREPAARRSHRQNLARTRRLHRTQTECGDRTGQDHSSANDHCRSLHVNASIER